jgi:hypothetical protein
MAWPLPAKKVENLQRDHDMFGGLTTTLYGPDTRPSPFNATAGGAPVHSIVGTVPTTVEDITVSNPSFWHGGSSLNMGLNGSPAKNAPKGFPINNMSVGRSMPTLNGGLRI